MNVKSPKDVNKKSIKLSVSRTKYQLEYLFNIQEKKTALQSNTLLHATFILYFYYVNKTNYS